MRGEGGDFLKADKTGLCTGDGRRIGATRGNLMSTQYLTKTKLAAMLPCTKRTLTNYVSDGILPAPTRCGRDAGWSIDVLRQVLLREPDMGNALSEANRSHLTRVLDDWELLSAEQSIQKTAPASDTVAGHQWRPLPEPALVDEASDPEKDFRAPHFEELRTSRGLIDLLKKEARQEKHGSREKYDLWKQIDAVRADVEDEERILDEQFICMHSSAQLLGTRLIFRSPLFNIRNQRTTRDASIKLELPLDEETSAFYEGPELRQDDGLVFMALLNIARDVRLGRAVGFSAQDLCQSLWGYYDGPTRARLKTMISRLQLGILNFPTFRVHLVERFDFPTKGLWSVRLDADIVNLFPRKEVVWLDLVQRRSLTSGLPTWLYGYIRSQTTLIPTKVERLRQLSGSVGQFQGFRSNLMKAMAVLTAARVVCGGWRIDKHEMLHWLKSS